MRRCTNDTLQLGAEKVVTAGLREYPGALLPGWIVPDVLRVTALQLSHPVGFLVLMESYDAPGDGWSIGETHYASPGGGYLVRNSLIT
jgi:hypothetical protein